MSQGPRADRVQLAQECDKELGTLTGRYFSIKHATEQRQRMLRHLIGDAGSQHAIDAEALLADALVKLDEAAGRVELARRNLKSFARRL